MDTLCNKYSLSVPGPGPSNDIDCVQNCQEDWEANGQYCYFWSNSSDGWNDAEQICRGKGGHLASVTSSAANEYILRELAKRASAEELWIGGTDEELEGTWKWTDGSAWGFSFWDEDRPSTNRNQNCLQYYSYHNHNRTKWYDYGCDQLLRFLCSQKICSGKYTNMHLCSGNSKIKF